ncbi:uncharacterized protein N7477_001931 [Penicillium maclennaniae]|uniref:uncharacterized protein n=1 Tax=Penicillium maclennaniae TaxID=1343394 RepID=UPI0025423179|nr:uncharacterized protein N7477_001931 [Penicillium maclennaniae]KAJ5681991.1 hypothetical protein N7477_001931 [Penicillium maclennaniae]
MTSPTTATCTMSLHGLGVIGAQVAASIKSIDEKPSSPKLHSTSSIQSTPTMPTPSLHSDRRSQEFDPHVGAKPSSPFYRHGSPTLSYEQIIFEPKSSTPRTRTHLRDIENAGPYIALRNDSPRRSKLWEQQKNPPRSCMSSLSTRQRMTLKIIVAVVTVGSMIAIALGITAAVGGAAWRNSARQNVLGG